ncbi:ArdC-like ssDNA-binding domain-containing protein, partial [Parvibaculum sp.]|uniref:ArdC-like ssDNA-binding domain-containing protein n=1 Tax=Parvibaculum sp. TaxID=2024848 RepID=UPI00345D0672
MQRESRPHMTYRQSRKLSGQVRRGEKSTIAFLYKTYAKDVEGSSGEDATETRRVNATIH